MKKKKRILHVKLTSSSEVTQKWGFPPFTALMEILMPLYIRCNVKGEVNWDAAPLYNQMDLIGKVIVIHK